MGPKVGLLGPIECLLVYLAQSFVSSCETFPNPTACDLLGYEVDFSLLIIVSGMSRVLHKPYLLCLGPIDSTSEHICFRTLKGHSLAYKSW